MSERTQTQLSGVFRGYETDGPRRHFPNRVASLDAMSPHDFDPRCELADLTDLLFLSFTMLTHVGNAATSELELEF